MAQVSGLTKLILKWEGTRYTNDPVDRGGPTKMGITLDTWRHVGYDKNGDGKINAEDVKLLNEKDFQMVLKKNFWDKWKADDIKNQSIANILVDWVWGSGIWGIKIPQRILGVKVDGVVGSKTIDAVNKANQRELFNKIFAERKQFLLNIVKRNPSQKKFIKGWLNRLNDFKFKE